MKCVCVCVCVLQIVSGKVKQETLAQRRSIGAVAESANLWIGCLKYTNDAEKAKELYGTPVSKKLVLLCYVQFQISLLMDDNDLAQVMIMNVDDDVHVLTLHESSKAPIFAS